MRANRNGAQQPASLDSSRGTRVLARSAVDMKYADPARPPPSPRRALSTVAWLVAGSSQTAWVGDDRHLSLRSADGLRHRLPIESAAGAATATRPGWRRHPIPSPILTSQNLINRPRARWPSSRRARPFSARNQAPLTTPVATRPHATQHWHRVRLPPLARIIGRPTSRRPPGTRRQSPPPHHLRISNLRLPAAAQHSTHLPQIAGPLARGTISTTTTTSGWPTARTKTLARTLRLWWNILSPPGHARLSLVPLALPPTAFQKTFASSPLESGFLFPRGGSPQPQPGPPPVPRPPCRLRYSA
ncbi:hypothetical protein Purlil1_8548 [Purpureocillium lilacinum]|uniref:Uncharacterized protein n=1 Tax=Purpureocillium lilacinum TaxID=33203 RepID=A0ABR0BSJ4_PURLI|nr:hypothetical protein Purlil1_8548 [Purpureocillium lilacinum]